jgi:hypothetical protein
MQPPETASFIHKILIEQNDVFVFLTAGGAVNVLTRVFNTVTKAQGNNKGIRVYVRPVFLPLTQWAQGRWIPTAQIPASVLDVIVAAAAKANTTLTALCLLASEPSSNLVQLCTSIPQQQALG